MTTACYPFRSRLHRRPVIRVGAGKCPGGALGRVYNSNLTPDPPSCPLCWPASVLDVTEGSPARWSPGRQTASIHGMHKGKESHKKYSSRSERSSSQQESSGRAHQHGQEHGSDRGGECVPSPVHPCPSSSRGEDCSAPWGMVMGAMAELWGDLEALKENRHMAPGWHCRLQKGCQQTPHGGDWGWLQPGVFWVSTSATA